MLPNEDKDGSVANILRYSMQLNAATFELWSVREPYLKVSRDLTAEEMKNYGIYLGMNDYQTLIGEKSEVLVLHLDALKLPFLKSGNSDKNSSPPNTKYMIPVFTVAAILVLLASILTVLIVLYRMGTIWKPQESVNIDGEEKMGIYDSMANVSSVNTEFKL